jgi:hypothetical protein
VASLRLPSSLESPFTLRARRARIAEASTPSSKDDDGMARARRHAGKRPAAAQPEVSQPTIATADDREVAALQELAAFVEANGGGASALAGWSCRVVTRTSGTCVGVTDNYYRSAKGKQLRSRLEVARYLGLDVTRVISRKRGRTDELEECDWVQCTHQPSLRGGRDVAMAPRHSAVDRPAHLSCAAHSPTCVAPFTHRPVARRSLAHLSCTMQATRAASGDG